jgi:hypothetical protein
MPMGIVSDKDFIAELEKNSSQKKSVPTVPTGQIVNIPTPGRKEGDVNVPNSLRNVIGQTSVENGRSEALELARQFGISPSSVSAYTNGATSTASYDEQPNAQVVNSANSRVSKRARAKLMLALSNLTHDKIASAKARDVAGIAKDMSQIMKNMEENRLPEGTETKKGPTFVFYSPQFFNEEKFETVLAKE